MTIHRYIGCLCLVAITANAAQAGDIQLSGFGSLVAGMRDHETPVSYAGYQYSDFDFGPDSLVGLQASTQLNDKASATMQLVSRGGEEWDTQVDWAYVRYAINDELAWRLGRIRVPFYLYSDFLSVGYAYPWITPPNEVYDLPFSNVNGADIVYLHSFGSVDMMLQGYLGSEKFTYASDSALAGNEGQTRNQFGLVSEFSWRSFKLRYAYHGAKVFGDITGTAIEPLITQLEALGLNDTADRFRLDRDYYDFHDLALQYDDGSLFFVVETTLLSAHDDAPGPVSNGGFVTGGYHFGTSMILLTYGLQDDKAPDLVQDIPANHPAYAVVQAVQNGLANDTEQWTIGYRWDFADGLAFKAEVINWSDKNDSDNDTILSRAGVQFVF